MSLDASIAAGGGRVISPTAALAPGQRADDPAWLREAQASAIQEREREIAFAFRFAGSAAVLVRMPGGYDFPAVPDLWDACMAEARRTGSAPPEHGAIGDYLRRIGYEAPLDAFALSELGICW